MVHMTIGPITLPLPFCQAGLAGYSDRAMRLVARRRGCPYAVTEALLDVILVNGGDDTLLGGAGNDRLAGGVGIDKNVGGGGADRIVDSKRKIRFDGDYDFWFVGWGFDGLDVRFLF